MPVAAHLKRLILPIYVPMMLLRLGMSSPIAAFPQHLGSLGASLAAVGFIISLVGIGQLISDLPGGLILTKFRVRPVVVVSFVIVGIASIGIGFTRSLVVVAVLRLSTGIFTSIIVTGTMTYVRLTVPAAHRGRALALVGGSFRIGWFIGPVLGGLIVDRLGMPYVFVLRTICCGVAILAVLSSPDRNVAAEETPRVRDQGRLVAEGLKGRWGALASVGTAVLVLFFLRTTRAIALPLWGDELGLSVTIIGVVISAGSIIDMLLFAPAGIVMDRAGRKVPASVCIGGLSVGILLLPLGIGVAGFVIASMLIGLGNGFGAGINMTLGTDLAPRNAASAFIGLWRLFGDVGQTLGPVLVGALASATGLAGSLYITAGVGAIGLLVMIFIAPETLHLARQNH